MGLNEAGVIQLPINLLPILQALHEAGLHHGAVKPADVALASFPSAEGQISRPYVVCRLYSDVIACPNLSKRQLGQVKRQLERDC